MMNPHLCLLLLLSAATVATAAPLLGSYEEVLVQMLKRAANEIAEVQKSGCSSRSHKVVYHLGQKTYIYRYRACLNHITNLMCYDNRENLPTLCPLSFRGEDCIEIEWRIHGSTKRFEICDKFGVPCQKRIPGMGRTDYNGNCISSPGPQPQPQPRPQPQPHPLPPVHPHPHPYPLPHPHPYPLHPLPHPHPHPYPLPHPFPHPLPPVHPHPHPHPLLPPHHPLFPHPGLHPHFEDKNAAAKEMGQLLDDCFCVTKGKNRVCRGKKCPRIPKKFSKFTKKAGKLDNCFCAFYGKKKICHGKVCPK